MARTSQTSSAEGVLDAMERADRALSQELCREKHWRGSLTAAANVQRSVPHVDPAKPPATFTTSISADCRRDGGEADCAVTYSHTISGQEVEFSESGSANVRVGASAGFARDGQFAVTIGRFDLPTSATLAGEGGSQTAKGSVQLGGWEGRGRALGTPSTQSGSARDHDVQVTWSVSRK